MRKILFTLTITVVILSTTSAQQDKNRQFGLNDSSYIKIVVDNVVDTIFLSSHLDVLIPFRNYSFKKLTISKPGEYRFAFATCRPAILSFYFKDYYQILLIPKDTVEVHIGFVNDKNPKTSFYFKPRGIIQEYYQAKKEKLGYYNFRDRNITQNLPSSGLSLTDYSKVIKQMDSLINQSNAFLDEHKNQLPEWFADMEAIDISFEAESLNKQLFSALGKEDRAKIFYIRPDFQNPKAFYSNFYYEYINNYFVAHVFEFDSVTSRPKLFLNRLKRMKPLIDSLLSEEIKYNYVAYELSDLYFFCENKEEMKTIENYINTNFPNLSKEQIQFINAVKYRNIKLSLAKGNKAPDFYLKDTKDKAFRLSDLKGKIVYIFFWTNTNELCIKEMPAINKLASKLSGKPVEIVNICLDKDLEKWKQIVEKEKLKGINLICKGNWAENLKNEYIIEKMPHFALIDAEGKIIENNCKNPDEIFLTIKQLLKD